MLSKRYRSSKNVFNKLSQLINTSTHYSTSHACEEIKIPVPWGHLAGKWWGSKNKRPILGFHGWQDNSGTFDRLAPYLLSRTGFLAIDFPGHGLSSHLPPGVYQHNVDYVATIRRVVQYFKWKKVSLLGHSYGAITCYLYNLFFPNNVDFLICLDGIKPVIFEIEMIDLINKQIDDFIKYDYLNNISPRPSFTMNELEKKLHEVTDKSISLEYCKHILNRCIVPSKEPEKFCITNDVRVKIQYIQNWPKDIAFESGYRLSCPTFMSHSSQRIRFYDHFLQSADLVEIIGKSNKHFEFHNVSGTHHVHLNNPQLLEHLINKFIEKYDKEDRVIQKARKD